MNNQQLPILDKTYQESIDWLKQIAEKLGPEHDMQLAYHAFRGVMFTIRDRMTVEETFDLSSQLPVLLRGVFFEGYSPHNKPEKWRSEEGFLERIEHELQTTGGFDPSTAAHAVIEVLEQHITVGEQQDVASMMPKELRNYFSLAHAAH